MSKLPMWKVSLGLSAICGCAAIMQLLQNNPQAAVMAVVMQVFLFTHAAIQRGHEKIRQKRRVNSRYALVGLILLSYKIEVFKY